MHLVGATVLVETLALCFELRCVDSYLPDGEQMSWLRCGSSFPAVSFGLSTCWQRSQDIRYRVASRVMGTAQIPNSQYEGCSLQVRMDVSR